MVGAGVVCWRQVTDEQDMLSLYILSDVVLDTFPAGAYINSLFAFAVGAPVITLPGSFLAGRLTLAMYDKMGVPREWCVASTAKEYVNLALQVAHNPQLRSRLVSRILASNYRLFQDQDAIAEWDRFLTTAVQRSNSQANIEVVAGGPASSQSSPDSQSNGGVGVTSKAFVPHSSEQRNASRVCEGPEMRPRTAVKVSASSMATG